jgi:hypothetical protein
MNPPPAPASLTPPRWIDWLGSLVQRYPRLWIGLGKLETRALADHIEPVAIEQPIYIAGLARAGSTVLLETLARHPDTATQAYRDFPAIFTPYLWNWFLDRAEGADGPARERAHGDGIQVTADSPEALEEGIWMAFFPDAHRAGHSDVLHETTCAPAFEAFYRDHLRKILWMRHGRRYLAKGNYNVTRMEYLLRLFPDARFVIPVREPEAHVASLMRQHRRFCPLHARQPSTLRYMQRLGHFEFGLDRRVIDVDDAADAEAIREAWARGDETTGLALQWRNVYRYVADRLDACPALRRAALVVRHEDLCRRPGETLREVMDHCGLEATPGFITEAAQRMKVAGTDNGLSASERRTIAAITGETRARFDYAGPVPRAVSRR